MSLGPAGRATRWLRANLFRSRREREMRDEMSVHLERAVALLRERGLPEDDAMKQARREFGDVAYHQTEGRDARGTLWLDALAADMRFALRHFARRPVTTVVMFFILAVGMTISSMLFSIVHSFASQPPPAVALQDDLVRIRGMDGPPDSRGARPFEADEFDAIRALNGQFVGVAGWLDGEAALLTQQSRDHSAVSSRVNFVTDNYFDVLGLHMTAGAGLPVAGASDNANSAVVVIDYLTWQQTFAKRRDAIGSTISLNGVPVTIVGVAPERFMGVLGQTRQQVWMPLSAKPLIAPRTEVAYRAFGRLRPGITAQAATAAVNAISTRIGMTTEERRKQQFSADVVTMLNANIDSGFDEIVRLQFLMIGSIALLILLVTCTNVSALLTGLASARRQEIAIRLSLGAARARIIRQLLTESAVLAIIAGVAALGAVALIMNIAIKLWPSMPIDLVITWPLTTFTFTVALTTGIAFGLSPALHATRMALASVLRDSSRGVGGTRAKLQQSLVVAQIAFTQPLVVALAGFLVLVLSTLQPRTLTDSADRVVSIAVQPTSSVAGTDAEQRALMNRLLLRLQNTPGVEKAVIDWGQRESLGKYLAADAGGAARLPVDLSAQRVAADYFGVLDVPVRRGHSFGNAEIAAAATANTATPVIIGADLAARVWGSGNALGRRLETTDDTVTSKRTLVVIGVVDDPIARSRAATEPWAAYLPIDTSVVPQALLIRTASAAQPILPMLRDIVNREAPGAVTVVKTLAAVEREDRRNLHLVYGGISAAAGIALLLAAIGLYAVVAFSVAQRTHEIAVRLSVGARGDQIARAFVGDGLKLSAIGMGIGLPVSLLVLQFVLNPMLVDHVALSPVAMISAGAVIIVAAAAAWIPARRAASVDPAVVLRNG